MILERRLDKNKNIVIAFIDLEKAECPLSPQQYNIFIEKAITMAKKETEKIKKKKKGNSKIKISKVFLSLTNANEKFILKINLKKKKILVQCRKY